MHLESTLASHKQMHSYEKKNVILPLSLTYVSLRQSFLSANNEIFEFFLSFSQLFFESIASEEIYHHNKIMKHSFNHFQELKLKMHLTKTFKRQLNG